MSISKYFGKTTSRIVLYPMLVLAFTSCQFLNKYKAPEYNPEGLYGDVQVVDSATIATTPWLEYFQDPFVRSLIDEGLENNFDLKIAVERIKIAEAYLMAGKLDYLPSLSLAGSYQFGRRSIDAHGNKDVLGVKNNQYSLGLATSWEIDVWGKINRQNRSKKAQFLSSIESKYAIQTALIANIANSYYALLSLDSQLKVTKAMVGLIEETTHIMEIMMNSGLQTAAAVEQSKALLYGTQSSIPTLEYNIKAMENTLCTLIGRTPGKIERGELSEQIVPEDMAYGVPAQMLANRPDVRAAELSFRSAFELTNVAQASFYPSISLSSGMLGYGSTELSRFFKPENLIATLIGNLTQPIFARGQLKANLKVAKANQEIALLTFEQTVLSAGTEVCNILNQFEYSLKINRTRALQIESLKKSVEFTQKLLKGGLVTSYIEVINAQQSLLNAELSQVSDKLTQLQCTVNLYRALGGGVE